MTIQINRSITDPLTSIPSPRRSPRSRFQVMKCTDYAMLREKMSEWGECARQAIAIYHRTNKKHTLSQQTNQEFIIFQQSKTIIKAIEWITQQSSHNQDIYICSAKKRIQAIAVIAQYTKKIEINDLAQDFLEVELLATHPSNIQSTLSRRHKSYQTIKGAGSYLLKFIEQLASKEALGVCVMPVASTMSFYTTLGYYEDDLGFYLIKTKDTIAGIANSTLKAA